MRTTQQRIHDVILLLLSAAFAIVLGRILWTGLGFYLTPHAERPFHEGFRLFRPAGLVGHSVGIVGSAMILLLLLYSVRKRVRRLRRWGDLQIWLKYHIFLGVAGPLLITVHAAGKVGGIVAISFWSMVAVAVSGIFGRFLYQQLPRNVLGEALSSDEIDAHSDWILVELTGPHAMDQTAISSLESVALGPLEGKAAPVALIVLPVVNLTLRRRLRDWKEALSTAPSEAAMDLAKQWVLLRRRWSLFHTIRDLFHYWHVFHKPFAIIMIIVMFIHIAVVALLGYTWPGATEAGG